MNKNTFAFAGMTAVIAIMIVAVVIYTDNGNYSVYANAGASPGGKTGSPTDINNCTQCHAGTLNPSSATRAITSAGLAGGYVPGQTYTINAAITGTSSNKIGFEVTAERNSNNSKTGTIIITDPTRTKTVNSGKAITHNSRAGTTASSGSNAWTFDWTAPATGTGTVTFYGSFNATNGNGGSSGDQVYTATFVVNEITSVGLSEVQNSNLITLFPNPTSEYIHISSVSSIEKVEIFSINGHKIVEENEHFEKINLTNFDSGIYMVKIFTKDGIRLEKLILE